MSFFSTLFVVITLFCSNRGDNDTYNIQLSNRYLQYCLISYCIGVGNHKVQQWDCDVCKQYFPDIRDVTVFNTNMFNYDIRSFIAYEPNKNEIIIAFSGTQVLSITNWISDLTYTQIKYPLSDECIDCKIHKGFYKTYNSIRKELWSTVAKYINTYLNANIVITGHSLGSALATHAVLDGYISYNIKYNYIYTYGSPRVGNINFAKYYDNYIKNHYRIVHRKDPVTQLPLKWMKNGYYHVGKEIYYPRYSNGSYIICDNYDYDINSDNECRNQYGLNMVYAPDHIYYLGYSFAEHIGKCKIPHFHE